MHLVLEGEVAAHGFPVAVEGKADQFAVAVDDGAARVAASDVVGRDEVHRQLSFRVGITSIILGGIQVAHILRDVKLPVAGNVFGHYAVHGGVVVVVHRIGSIVRLHGSVGQAHGEVGVGVEVAVALHGHKPFHVKAFALVAQLLCLEIAFQKHVVGFDDVLCQSENRVFIEFLGLLNPALKAFGVGENGFAESFLHVSAEIALMVLSCF